jgi:TolA-binding protein
MEPNDPGRKTAFEDAIKGFEDFIQKFPQSAEVESANYGLARVHSQIENFEEAAKALRVNLQRFANSPSALDTQFLLAVVLGAQATTALQKATAKDPAADAAFTEAEKLLAGIIQKRSDIALANDAQFQLGELLAARGGFERGDAQKGIFYRGLEAYRAVLPKELVVKAQQDRLVAIREALRASAGDVNRLQNVQRLQQREIEKLAALEQRGDLTLAAKIKSGQIFLGLGLYDEARILMRFVEQFTEDIEQKKQLLYFTTLTYAAQQLPEKAVEYYEKFQSQYKGDPIAANLPLFVGTSFLGEKGGDPEKAITYFKEQAELYPNSRYTAEAAAQEAEALRQLQRYDDAIATLTRFLATNPSKELAAAAEFNLATIYKDTGKVEEALKSYRSLREKYAEFPEGERAGFWLGQMSLATDPKGAQTELQTFLSKFPQSELAPAAMLYIGQAQVKLGEKEGALKTWQELAQKHPQSEPAPASYFQRAGLHQNDNEYDQVIAIMREMIAAYPEGERIYAAYDYIAQIQIAQKAPLEAIASYEEFIEKRPEDPNAPKALVRASTLWRTYAEGQGPYLTLNEEKRTEWTKGLQNSAAAAERVLEKYPESGEVALALQNLLAVQRLELRAKVKTESGEPKTEESVAEYFQGIAKRFDNQPATKNKVLFTLAGFVAEKDEEKAAALMQSAYDPSLVYAPADLDLYGAALLAKKDYEQAQKVYDKLAADYPVPANTPPERAPRGIGEAQSIALFGTAKILQEQGKNAEAAEKFAQLKKTYPWSPKLLESDYGIAAGLFEEKKYDEAHKLLVPVVTSRGATNLRARAMMLIGRIAQAKGELDAAINNYIKVGVMFESEAELAAEGNWLGAQLLEQKASQ